MMAILKNIYGHVKKLDRNYRYMILDNGIRLALDDIVNIIHLPKD